MSREKLTWMVLNAVPTWRGHRLKYRKSGKNFIVYQQIWLNLLSRCKKTPKKATWLNYHISEYHTILQRPLTDLAQVWRAAALHNKKFITYQQWQTVYTVAQKSKPLPNYQKIVLNRIKVCQWD